MKVSLKSTTEVPDPQPALLLLRTQRANVFRFHLGRDLLGSTSTSFSVIRRMNALEAIRFEKGAKRLPHRASSSTFARARARSGVPWSRFFFVCFFFFCVVFSSL